MTAATLSLRAARRLALARAGLLGETRATPPSATRADEPASRRGATRTEHRRRERALATIRRFGYLQLDTVSVAGARSHAIVLASRDPGFPARLGEELLRPGEPLFEYWGHEACWLPLELYPFMAFRRRRFRVHPWWGDVLGEKRHLADHLLRRLADEGPLRAADLEGASRGGWWALKESKIVASALWSAGEIVVRERRAFLRTYDLPERVLPPSLRDDERDEDESLQVLLLQALAGHGWATTGTLSATWRLRNQRPAVTAALRALADAGAIVACDVVADVGGQRAGGRVRGWARPADLELAAHLEARMPRGTAGVLLSPFDPLLWDRDRTRLLFDFDATIEIFKRAEHRRWGYYCLPVLAGEALLSRVDLKADRRRGRLELLARHDEPADGRTAQARADRAVATALARYARQVELAVTT